MVYPLVERRLLLFSSLVFGGFSAPFRTFLRRFLFRLKLQTERKILIEPFERVGLAGISQQIGNKTDNVAALSAAETLVILRLGFMQRKRRSFLVVKRTGCFARTVYVQTVELRDRANVQAVFCRLI